MRFGIKLTSLLTVLTFSFGSILSAESSIAVTRKIDTVHIVPGQVHSDFWKKENEALIQDVNEDALYQSFNTSNSAYVELKKSPESSDNVNDSGSPLDSSGLPYEPPANTDDIIEDVSDEPKVEYEAEPSLDTQQDLEALSTSFFKFTDIADTILPLAQESFTTPLVSETEAESVSDTVSEVETSEVVPVIDTPIIEDPSRVGNAEDGSEEQIPSDEVVSSDPLDIETESDVLESETAIEFEGFDIPKLNSGQLIKNAQLRLSLGSSFEVTEGETIPRIDIEYSLGDFWDDAGTILLDGEVSNALNGGYFLFALPKILHADEFEDLRVRLVYTNESEAIGTVYIDSLWLELNTETFDKELLKERLLPSELSHLQLPTIYEFLSSELDFARGELPRFELRYESQRNFAVRIMRNLLGKNLVEVEDIVLKHISGGRVDVVPQVDVTADGLFTIQLDAEGVTELQPGAYEIEITVNEGGKEFTDTLSFQWGLIAINSDQTEYKIGDTAIVSLGALSENGNTLCDANLALYVIDPEEYISEVPVTPSGLCNGNNVIDRPDYNAQIIPTVPGTYEMYVENLDSNGDVIAHTSDTFIVVGAQDVAIRRVGPTRIYPVATYPMELQIIAPEGFTGTLTERVPLNFVISDTDAIITETDTEYILSWDINLEPQGTQTVRYMFDAPDISPYLYTLGPAEMMNTNTGIVISEAAPTPEEPLLTETVITTPDGTPVVTDTPIPTEIPVIEALDSTDEIVTTETVQVDEIQVPVSLTPETVVPDVQPTEELGFFESIVDTLFGGSDETTPVVTESEVVLPQTVVEEPGIFESIIDTLFGSEEVIDSNIPVTDVIIATTSVPVIDAEGMVTTTATGTLTFVEHRKWQIASDATGSMLLYWGSSTIPAGWTCVSCQVTDVYYQRFIMGSSTAGTNGGAATHTHTATGAFSVTGSAGVSSAAGGGVDTAILAHGHTLTPAISTVNNLPAYTELAVIQFNSAGSPPTIPAGAIAMFDATVPSGWTQYAPLDGRYVRSAASTTAGTASSSNTHAHTITGTSGASDTNTNGPGAAGVGVATNVHTHTVSTTTVPLNHEPRYRETIFGRLTATSSPTDAMIAMWTDTPPSGWGTVSSSSEPFENRFAKGSTTYGGVGGAATSTHTNISNIISGAPVGTANRTAGGTSDADSTHTHNVSVTNFSVATNTPPFRTAIFAKRAPGGAVPDEPTLHVLFNNEKTGTSTPQFEFTGLDLDGSDTLVYQFEWDDDKDLDTAPTGSRTSDDESGCSPNCFSNTASTTDTSPFTENERIRFTIQSGLTSGTTYYWRVRVKETVGDTWSDWSAVQSFTYQSGVTLSEWFQTQGSQFDGGTLVNIATTSDTAQLSSTTLTQVPVVASGWSSSTAAAAASLTLTKPSGIEVGDLLLILVGNDDNTATAQWDDISLRPTGFTMINEAGNNTPDTHVAAFYRIADGTEGATTSVPAQGADNFWGFYIRVTGASTTNPINVIGADYAVNNLASHPVPSITTTRDNTLAFYMLAGDAVGTAPFTVSGTGWSESAEITINTAGTWGTRSMATAGATGNATVGMNASDGASGFQFAINPATPFGTIMSPEVDFDLVAGQTTWGEVGWDTTEPANTNTKLRVYYSSTSTCDALVPDTVLAGNSAGFTTSVSPFHIVNLSTTTYNRICLKTTFDMGTGASSPTLNDWTIRWVRTSQLTQSDYIWYANTDALAPTDIWPVGVVDLEENDAIDATSALLGSDVIRLRMSITATSSAVATTSTAFKLQYTEGETCSVDSDWNDVGAIGSTTARFRGYDNASVADGASLASTILTSATHRESYEEENNTALNPYAIPIGGIAEWDWTIQNNDGVPGATYCFRMVRSDGTRFFTYTNYPTLVTNDSPDTFTLIAPFDNEKVSSTTPYFDFTGTDTESNDLTYQIQIDDDRTFASVNIENDTVTHSDQFQNINTPADKDPYTNGETIRFTLPSTLTNGVTYYWRVRAQDPDGSNEWGDWSTVYSLTVDTSVIVSTWFQTTEEQFDTDTLVGTDAIGTDLVQLIVGSTTGTTTTSEIDFINGSLGNAWGSLAWTDNETAGDIKYRVQYFDIATESWEFVPDSDLAGNAAGFDTSPISLLDLNIETYEAIRLVGIFTNSGGTPTLSDWTVSWGYRIETPTINAPFRNEKVATTTPTFEFTTTDPQGDSMVYEIQWSASSTFAASTTRISSTSAGFTNITNGGDTSPFNSGDTIQFEIQTADALINGRTYWWRVRATDGQYSFYTDAQSFTVDTSVVVSTWFQTTAEQFNTDTLSGVITQGTSSVTIATTSSESLIAYAEGTITTPRYQIWDGSTWGGELSALDVGAAIGWVVTKASPSGNEYIMATMGTDADVNVQVYANGSWGNLQEITNAIPNTNMRGFDVAYEQSSGDALAVTCDGDTVASYWIWDGTSWTNAGPIGSVLNYTCGWIKLISDPISDEIIAIVRDTGGVRYEARVWDGSAWGNSATLGSMSQTTHEGIAAEYEDSGNQAVIVASNAGNSSFQWRAWTGAAWSATATVAIGDDFEAGAMVADDGTDNMALCYVDEDADQGVMLWTGAGFTAFGGTTERNNLWVTAGNIYNDRPIDCAYEISGSRNGLLTAVFSTSTAMASSTWNGTAWSTNQKISTLGQSGVRVQLRRTGTGLIQAVSYASTTDRYEYADWNGTTWSAIQILEANAAAGATPFKEPFMIAPKNPVTVGSVVGDPVGIDFYAGSGPYWQQMSWNDTESGGSTILYQVEYYNTASSTWDLIPDSLIPGNSTGTSTSPIDLSDVLPVSTYSLIRPVANMTCNLGTCPSLQDWNITWSAGIVVSGTAQGYDQATNTSSGTVAIAVNGSLQIGKTGTISATGTWSIANVNVAPGDVVTVFINGTNDPNEAAAIARYDGVGDMSGLRLYARHVTLGSNDATTTPFTNAVIGLYDYPNDEDLFFSATSTTLDMCVDVDCSDSELYIMASSTYRPTGVSDLNDIENNGTLELQGNTIYIAGSWDNNGTTTSATSTVVFTATSTTETIDEYGAVSASFYNLTLGTTTGYATWNATTTLDINNNFTVSRGIFARGTTSITIGGSLTNAASGTWTGVGTTTFDGSGTSNWSDASTTAQNVGRVVVNGTSKTIALGGNVRAQSVTIGADDILDATTAPYSITVLTDWINNNTFVPRTGTVTFTATTTNRIITAGGDAFYNLTFNGGGGAWSFTETDLSVANDFTVATGTVTMPTGTTTLAGSFSSVGGTFAHNNATVNFTSGSAETVAASGTVFTNAFYNIAFNGSGSWTFLDTHATTSNDMRIVQGTVTFPSNTLSVGGTFDQSGGTFAHNNGTVKFTSATDETIDLSSSSFYGLHFSGIGTRSFIDASVSVLDDIQFSGGTTTLPSGTLSLGGSFVNTATTSHNNGTVLFNSVDTGETISLGSSSLYNMTFNGVGGGWTITNSATTTNNFTIATTSLFTLASGQTLSVGGTFTNSVGGASTTWTGSIISLEAGNYSINTKSNTGDAYGEIRIKANTDIQMWNSTSTNYVIDGTGSLYSQDHNAVDGNLYIFGNYPRTSGTEYWSAATDFDGTALGASARQVHVRFASGASASLSSSTLNLVGSSTATTTVDNQGAGTYTIDISRGTTTAQYYSFTNLGATGVSLLASNKVTSLRNGAIAPGTSGGTGLTLSSTTIDANSQLQIYNVNFSTTSGIVVNNVKQIDGTPTSYWWFRESEGSVDGEAYDLDTGDPGSVRWDNSSLTITVSGTVYRDDGITPMSTTTCDDVTPNIRIVVQNGSAYTGSCASADGTYSIPGVVIIGSPVVTVYLNTNGGAQATVVTKTPTADITDLNLYANRIITRHEDVDALTVADMAVYDSGNDTDIRYDAATTSTSSVLTVFAGNELHIASSTTFAPGGNITINGNASSSSQDGSLHIDDNAIFTGSGTSTYTIAGSFTLDQGATFTSASTTVVMNATTTGKTLTTGAAQTINFNTLQFTGVGGGWNINGAIQAVQDIIVSTGTVSGTSNITVLNGSLSGNGTVSMGSGTTTINASSTLGGTTPWTFGNLVLGNGSVSGTTTPGGATTTILGKLTISTGHYLDGRGTVWNLAGTGNVFVETGTFLEGTSTVRYSGAGATNVLSTTYYNLDLKALGGSPTYTATGLGIIVANDFTVGGAATTTFTLNTNDPALDVNGNVYITTTGTLQGSNSGAFTVAGSWDNDGSFVHNSGTVTFDSAGLKTVAAGSSSFSTVTVNGAGTFTFTEHATATAAFTLTNATAFSVSSGQVLAVGGTFTNSVGGAATTWTGSKLALYSGTNYAINASTTSDNYETLEVRTNTDIRMWNSDASEYTIDATGSLYSQDHGGVNGALYVYGNYPGNGSTDYWSYATDFDGTPLSGSERKVDVYFANGASALITSGGLSVQGGSSASTTVQNQGAGTYGIRIGGTASTSWLHYEIRNMDSSGLTFSGTPQISTLSRGDIEVSQNGGSGMTVGGTVITANPAKNFVNNIFATSTGITGFNVTATGTSISSWRFTTHSGAIDGEAYDVDPDGDPGYLVWDDSTSTVSISGRVFSDEGVTVSNVCAGTVFNISLYVDGVSQGDVDCDAITGAYTFTDINFSVNDSLIVYVNGEAEVAATVSADLVSSISNFDLYENRVIVRHENTDPLTIADMAVWDSSDDVDIPFTAIDGGTDTLTLPANRKLIVWDGKEFEPNGNVTLSGGGGGAAYDGTLELFTNAIFDATGAESHAVGGSFISGTGATFDDETSTFTFTTSGAARTIDTNEASFYNAVFNGSGSWNVTNTTFQIGNDLTITQGAVTLPLATTTITGSLSVGGAGSFIAATSSTMVFDSVAAETILARSSVFGTLITNGTGSFILQGTNATVTKNLLIQNGTFTSATGTLTIGGDFITTKTFTHGSGNLRFISTTTAQVTASTSDLYSTTFAANGTYTFTNTNVALLGSLTIASGTVNLASGTMSIAGSLVNSGGAFNHSSGTILFNSSDVGEIINPGASPFYAVTIASAGGGWTMNSNATTTSNFSLTSATNFTLSSSTRLTVQGVFTNLVGGVATTWTGSTLAINSGSTYTVNSKIAGGDTYNNLIVGSSTALRLWDSAGTISMADTLSSVYSQDHAGVSGSLNIYGNYARSTGADYWSYATDFDGTALGGGSRQVFVYFGNGATTTVTGGTLAIVGANGFDTTISNQGSGTYALQFYGGTLSAQYYSLSNMNSNGLLLAGTTTVSSLTEGNFTLAVDGGSLITLGSTTLNYNAGLVAVNNSFATTTAITGYNVNLVGTTSTAWTFTGHTGNFDGEAFDNDGIDACGSIRWDDSACLLTQQSGYRFRNDDGGEGVPDSEWYNASWTKRKRVTVTNADAVTYTNATVKLAVSYDSDMQSDFDDLIFTTSDGVTPISHYREIYTASTDAVVWVEVPTLATSTDTDIYMYYGNGAATDGSATSTFIFADSFEDGNITEYSGDTGEYSVSGSGAYERTNKLVASDPDNGKTDVGGMYNNSYAVAQGQTLRYLQYIDATQTGDEICTTFGTQSQTQNYGVCLELFGTDRMSLVRNVLHRDTSGTVLASTTVTYATGWYEVEIDWRTNNSMYVSLYKDSVLVATTTATDSNYTSGGVGYTLWTNHGALDMYTSRTYITTEPTVSFGFEQVSGGATWIAALNTPTTAVNVNDTIRARFLVENTGNQVSGQQYEIEYAAKGSSPSCEAVNYSNYVEVPNVASCGTSEICMALSSNISNLASTTDILGGDGTFTYGQIVESPSNNIASTTLENNQYTELEYVITPTSNVTDTNYCLRVSNEGTDLDSYTHVAEFGLVFTPNITSLSLNGGADITLMGGATTTVTATGTVTDFNGYTDIVGASTTIFRSGVGESCTLDNNNCYLAGNSSCSFSNCSGDSCDVSCSVDIYYHADPTDIGTYAAETWRALLSVIDTSDEVATSTAPSVDLITLRSIAVDNGINYGSLEVNSDTGAYNATTTVQNIGNDTIDISLEGTNLTDGGVSAIPVTYQKFATSTFTYSSCVFCNALNTTPANFEVDLTKPTTTVSTVTDELFWGIAIPYGVAGTAHQGVNTFYAIGD